jgi:hypothetical protein
LAWIRLDVPLANVVHAQPNRGSCFFVNINVQNKEVL